MENLTDEKRLRLLIEAQPISMIMTDITGKITFINKRTETLFGYTQDELIDQNIEMLVPKRFRKTHSEYTVSFFKEPQARPMGAGRDLVGIHKDGREILIEIGLTPIKTEEGQFVLASIIDITERKHLEELLKQKTIELERSNKELEHFAFVASHDLQEPLRQIISFSDLLNKKYHNVIDEKADTYLHYMHDSALRMRMLIKDILELSRVTTKALPFKPVNLETVVHQVINDLEVKIKEKHGKVEISNLPTINAEENQMRQLFQNLISNSLKFSKKNISPHIIIESKNISNGKIEIKVQDNGIGFDKKDTERIFQLFQRLHTNEEYEGTGVGLAICKKIMEYHNGKITACSQVGKGTTFILSFPSSTIF
ncbi:MAG: PAS domain S-box protein [Candidatus Melainabacteria bacterium]|nr:PAS domain S-box protein [Candidatus Melainabacteria bacterium]